MMPHRTHISQFASSPASCPLHQHPITGQLIDIDAHKGKKEIGEVSMEEFEKRSRGMLTIGA